MITTETVDLYGILGISREATPDEIRRAYHSKALQYHPDKNPNDEEYARFLFEQAGDAYRILSSQFHRNEYDSSEVTDMRSQQQKNYGFEDSSQVGAISNGGFHSIQTLGRNAKNRTFEEWMEYFLNEVQVDVGLEDMNPEQLRYESLGRKFLIQHSFSVKH